MPGDLLNRHGQVPHDSLGAIPGGKGSRKRLYGEEARLEVACPALVVHAEADHGEIPRPAHDEAGLFQHFSCKRRLRGLSRPQAARWKAIDVGRVVPLPLKENPAVRRRDGESYFTGMAGDVLPDLFLVPRDRKTPLNPKDAGQRLSPRVSCP